MGCLLSIPIILLFLVIFFSSALLRIVQALFGGSPRTNRQTRAQSQTASAHEAEEETYYDSDGGTAYRRRHSNGPCRKIFAPDEGEYVDFEEIRED